MNRERQAAHDWETAYGGGVRAAGVGVAIAGTGAKLIIIDDPIRGRKEANSLTVRDAIHEAYTDDLVTRLEPGGAIVGTVTRWMEDDLPGRIAASEEGPDWVTVNLPALAEEDDPLGRSPGEALWPARYPVDVLERRRTVMGVSFYALFQGRPAPAEGNKFKGQWFRYYRVEGEGESAVFIMDAPDGYRRVVPLASCRRFGTMDTASSIKTSADYSVIASWAVTPQSDLILLEVIRERLEEPDLIRRARDAYRRHRLSYLSIESNSMGLGIIQTLRRGSVDPETRKRLPGLAVRGIPSLTDKVSRAGTAIVRCESGQIWFPQMAPWLAEFEMELLGFPLGAHDDQVDTMSTAAEDVFYSGGGSESDHLQAAKLEAERMIERQEKESVPRDMDDERWWNGG